MQAVIGIIVLVLPIVVYLLTYKASVNYFSKLYYKYNKNPISVISQILGFLFYSPILIGCFNSDLILNPIVYAGIPVIVTGLLIVFNLKWINPFRIVWLTVLQIVFGGMFIVRLFVWFYLVCSSFMGNAVYGERNEVTYSPFSMILIDKDKDMCKVTMPFYYKPDYNPNSAVDIANRIQYDMNVVRQNSERLRLEREIADLEQKKQDAMIYGMDTAGYETKQRQLENELDAIK